METPKRTKITTGIVRGSYLSLFEPKEQLDSDSKPKYQGSFLIPKTDTVTLGRIKDAIAAAEAEALAQGGKWNGKKPKQYKDPPLRDGDLLDDEPKNEPYKGHYYISAKANAFSKTGNPLPHPPVVGLEKDEKGNYKPITDPLSVYSGCYLRVNLSAYAFDAKGNKGIAWAINTVQKVKDGEPLGGGYTSPEDAFDELEMDDLEDSDGLLD